ncbi:MAG TPA: alpha/beta hydrolase [Candidatus Saccharimonadales bacterium]|nr:alpha/beta hydrolase [Candidatus Saccharimonadales bacterium]
MKTAIVIPGFKQQVANGPGSRMFQPLLGDLKAAGYEVVPIAITWDRQDIVAWAAEAERQISQLELPRCLLIGFSFGAMTAAVLATRHVFGRVFLCSLSPYFAEDVPRARSTWLAMAGKRRIETFSKLHFAEVVRDYKPHHTTVFLGTWEMKHRKAPVLGERGKMAAKLLPGARLVMAEGAGHDLSHPAYKAAIKANL